MKVARIALGDLSSCLVLLALEGVGMGRQKAAKILVAARRWADPAFSLGRGYPRVIGRPDGGDVAG